MTIARACDWFQIAAVGCLLALGVAHGLSLYARGVRVIVVDRQRSPAQALRDLLCVACFLLWGYEVVAWAWRLRAHVLPPLFGIVLVDAIAVKIAGGAAIVLGLVIYGLALRAFGNSWRLGIDRKTPGSLVTHGVFTWTRNPIYVSLDLLAAGTFMLQGRLVFFLLAVVIAAMLHDQIRREERFLAATYGDAYREYAGRVRRYL